MVDLQIFNKRGTPFTDLNSTINNSFSHMNQVTTKLQTKEIMKVSANEMPLFPIREN